MKGSEIIADSVQSGRFPLAEEPTAYSSLEAVAQGSNSQRKFMREELIKENVLTVVMQNGTEAESHMIGCRTTDQLNTQLRAVLLIDLSQVQEIRWDGFTIVPR